MAQQAEAPAPAPAGPARWSDRFGLRLVAMVVVTFLLAALAVLVRTKLAPDLANARGTTAMSALPAPTSALVALVDTERKRAGCAALRIDRALMASAQGHAADMDSKGYAAETGSDGSGPQQRAATAGYRGAVVEILAAGIASPAQVFAQWTNPQDPASAAVMAKMTDCSRVGVGIGYSPGRALPTFGPGIWVVDLGDR